VGGRGCLARRSPAWLDTPEMALNTPSLEMSAILVRPRGQRAQRDAGQLGGGPDVDPVPLMATPPSSALHGALSPEIPGVESHEGVKT